MGRSKKRAVAAVIAVISGSLAGIAGNLLVDQWGWGPIFGTVAFIALEASMTWRTASDHGSSQSEDPRQQKPRQQTSDMAPVQGTGNHVGNKAGRDIRNTIIQPSLKGIHLIFAFGIVAVALVALALVVIVWLFTRVSGSSQASPRRIWPHAVASPTTTATSSPSPRHVRSKTVSPSTSSTSAHAGKGWCVGEQYTVTYLRAVRIQCFNWPSSGTLRITKYDPRGPQSNTTIGAHPVSDADAKKGFWMSLDLTKAYPSVTKHMYVRVYSSEVGHPERVVPINFSLRPQ